ncbi:uncharacterized protein N7487_002168 [Penicillium crustosum]|uniref:uncharacterized protein n=1 Tax=Penicillium crustosum TaxID=36656 RepID=UPI00239A6ED7|nr:uncharacterized protein N7487_002168 [Penicillium crustosum]KAJ5418618.1 hypothetical protein N7487_002168 [Penicillium crustosum]
MTTLEVNEITQQAQKYPSREYDSPFGFTSQIRRGRVFESRFGPSFFFVFLLSFFLLRNKIFINTVN